MTETGTAATTDQPPPAALPPAPRLVRPEHGKKVGGVCEGLGRHTGTDPLIWRVTIVVLAFFGGAGVALYVLAWVLVPKEGEPTASLGERLATAVRLGWPFPVLALLAGAVVLLFAGDDPDVLVPALVLGGIAYLVLDRRSRPGAPVPPATSTPASYDGPAPTPSLQAGPAFGPPVFGLPALPPPPPGSRLGRIVVSVALLVAGGLLVARQAGVDGLDASRVLAAALVVVGLGLVVGTWWGRARWLAFVGIVLAVALVPAQLDGRWAGGIGERRWTVDASNVATASDREFRLGVGEAVLDLRGVPAREVPLALRAEVGVGHLLVLLPSDLTVRVTSQVGLGELAGIATDEGTGLDSTSLVGPEGSVDLELDLELGTGELEVRRDS